LFTLGYELSGAADVHGLIRLIITAATSLELLECKEPKHDYQRHNYDDETDLVGPWQSPEEPNHGLSLPI
jgi:hypothetical protein